jgi:hypothetical protein
VAGKWIFQLTPYTVPANFSLEDTSFGVGKLENTSGRECTIDIGEVRKDLAEAIYPPVSEFINQQTSSS